MSWQKHHNCPLPKLAADRPDFLLPLFEVYFEQVSEKRKSAEKYALAMLTSSAKEYSVKHNLLHLANWVPSATVGDLIRSSFDKFIVQQLNPFLSQNARKQLDSVILHFLELCVLEDKLKRLIFHAIRNSKQQVIQELNSIRLWDVVDHPSWLAFEVENMLQIRPEQFEIAEHLLAQSGSISQLNMGNTDFFIFIFLYHADFTVITS
jgi:hypothetical protein